MPLLPCKARQSKGAEQGKSTSKTCIDLFLACLKAMCSLSAKRTYGCKALLFKLRCLLLPCIPSHPLRGKGKKRPFGEKRPSGEREDEVVPIFFGLLPCSAGQSKGKGRGKAKVPFGEAYASPNKKATQSSEPRG